MSKSVLAIIAIIVAAQNAVAAAQKQLTHANTCLQRHHTIAARHPIVTDNTSAKKQKVSALEARTIHMKQWRDRGTFRSQAVTRRCILGLTLSSVNRIVVVEYNHEHEPLFRLMLSISCHEVEDVSVSRVGR